MTQSPAGAGAPADALELFSAKSSAERALTTALASFQQQVQAVPSLDLAAVVEAARPAFASGLAFCAQLVDIHGRHKLRVTVMHAGGAEVSSEEWVDQLDNPLQASGWMLAMLLGIPLAKQTQPVEPEASQAAGLAEVTAAAASGQCSPESQEQPTPDTDVNAALEPLTPEEIELTHQRILALPQVARQELTKAFREHFQVPRSARSIGDRITQRQHAAFIEHFLEECHGQERDDTPVPAEP
jgi:hypothetical protein